MLLNADFFLFNIVTSGYIIVYRRCFGPHIFLLRLLWAVCMCIYIWMAYVENILGVVQLLSLQEMIIARFCFRHTCTCIPDSNSQDPSLPDHVTPALTNSQSLHYWLGAGASNAHTHTRCPLYTLFSFLFTLWSISLALVSARLCSVSDSYSGFDPVLMIAWLLSFLPDLPSAYRLNLAYASTPIFACCSCTFWLCF